MSKSAKISKSRKLAVHRTIRRMTKRLDSCIEFPDHFDIVDLVFNLDTMREAIAEYRKALINEISLDEALADKWNGYLNTLSRKAMKQVGDHFAKVFAQNPDLLRGDVIDATASDVARPALEGVPESQRGVFPTSMEFLRGIDEARPSGGGSRPALSVAEMTPMGQRASLPTSSEWLEEDGDRGDTFGPLCSRERVVDGQHMENYCVRAPHEEGAWHVLAGQQQVWCRWYDDGESAWAEGA